MKKAILTIGLFTLVLASTSFTSPKNTTSSIADNSVATSSAIDGAQSSGGNRKVDYVGSTLVINNTNLIADIDGAQSSGGNRKVD